MTLGRLATLLTAVVALASLVGFLSTGSLLVACGLLVAPLPSLIVFGACADRSDWTLGELLQGPESLVDSSLDEALRPPPVPGLPEDDGSFVLPGVPALPASRP